MIHIFENFLSEIDCEKFIDLFEEHKFFSETYRDTEVLRNINNQILEEKFFLIEKQFSVKLNYFEIVKWPVGSKQDLHLDGLVRTENHFTGILYLNENFTGGQTVIEENIINPKCGTFIFFEGSKLKHKVNKIIQGTRYTIPCWFRKI